MYTDLERFHTYYFISQILASNDNINIIAPKILQQLVENLKWSFGGILMNFSNENLGYLSSWGIGNFAEDQFLQGYQSKKYALNSDFLKELLQSNSPVWTDNIKSNKYLENQPQLIQYGVQSLIHIPLMHNQSVVGIIELFTTKEIAPIPSIMKILNDIGDLIAQYVVKRKLESELKRRDHWKTAISQAALDCIVTINQLGIITEFNPEAEKTFLYRQDDAIGKPMHELIIPPKYRDQHCNGFAKYLETKQSKIIGNRLELEGMRANGEVFPMEVTVIDLAKDRNEDKLFTGFFRDITCRKEYERLNNAKKEAEYQKKIIEEGEVHKKNLETSIANICHELRNPLNVIMNSIDILSENQEALKQIVQKQGIEKECSEYLTANTEFIMGISKCAHHQKNIIDQLLDFAKLNAGKTTLNYAMTELKHVLEEALGMSKARLEKKIIMELHIPEIPPLYVDGGRVKQVLMNLISNAIKFSPNEGKILIKVIELEGDNKNRKIEFSVEDHGIGLSEDEKRKLFQRFTQANIKTYSEYGGTGLGLSICKQLVDLMGGQIKVEGEKGKGSKFIFSILCPKVHTQLTLDNQNIVENKHNNYQNQNFTILIAEDNLQNQKILCHLLKKQNYKYKVVGNGKEAIEVFKKEEVSLILMDMEMPEMDGLQATRAIRKLEKEKTHNLPPVIIIGVSGNTGDEYCQKAMDAGMQEYMVKPYVKGQLLEAMNRLLAERAVALEQSQRLNAINKHFNKPDEYKADSLNSASSTQPKMMDMLSSEKDSSLEDSNAAYKPNVKHLV